MNPLRSARAPGLACDHHRLLSVTLWLRCLTALLVPLANGSAAPAAPPNIILIVADDMGDAKPAPPTP